jgi:hypothetical protein
MLSGPADWETQMAKRAARNTGTSGGDLGTGSTTTTEERLGDFAEDLGRFLGNTQAKASAWLDQRKQLLDSLVKVRDTAAHYIEQLGGSADQPRRGRRPKSAAAAEQVTRPAGHPAKRKRTMSAEARAKIAAAQRARWARHRKNKGQ